MCLMRGRENPAAVLLMDTAPASRGRVSGEALARAEWSPAALAAGRGAGPPIKCGAASPAATIRAKPATVAAAQAGLCRSLDAIGDR